MASPFRSCLRSVGALFAAISGPGREARGPLAFETLLEVDDRGIQALLREVPNDLLVVALKGCDPEISDKILSNMSKRAGTLLREDMEAKGPIRLSEVEAAQKEILTVARRLADAGEINLGGGGGEAFI